MLSAIASYITPGRVLDVGNLGYDWIGGVRDFNDPALMTYYLLMELSALMTIVEKSSLDDVDVVDAAKVATGSLINLVRAIGIRSPPEDIQEAQDVNARESWLEMLSQYAYLLLLNIKEDSPFKFQLHDMVDLMKYYKLNYYFQDANDANKYVGVSWTRKPPLRETITYDRFMHYVQDNVLVIQMYNKEKDQVFDASKHLRQLYTLQLVFLGSQPNNAPAKFSEIIVNVKRKWGKTLTGNRNWRSDMLIHLLLHNQSKSTLQLMISHAIKRDQHRPVHRAIRPVPSITLNRTRTPSPPSPEL